MEKQAKIQWSQIVELPTDCLIPFKNHPFKVVTDYQMIQLTESIRECGILTPLIVRPEVDGKYEDLMWMKTEELPLVEKLQ